jgi:hypothetical protein
MKLSERIIKNLYPVREWLAPAKRRRLVCDATGEAAGREIAERLTGRVPCMIGRFGATELAGMMCVMDIASDLPLWKKRWLVLRGEMRAANRWNPRIRQHMADWSGFFPLTDAALEQFTALMQRDARELDVLGSWLAEEVRIRALFEQARIIPIDVILRPDQLQTPWTLALKEKKVLVVHPFARSIQQQYEKRDLLFGGRHVFPTCALTVFQAVQSLRGEHARFGSWFEALNWMSQQIDQMDFDVALLGCGAYGFPLAAHIKRSGRKAVHVGGALQLLFGIMGKRWEHDPTVCAFQNEHWIRPQSAETPRDLGTLEGGGCYW